MRPLIVAIVPLVALLIVSPTAAASCPPRLLPPDSECALPSPVPLTPFVVAVVECAVGVALILALWPVAVGKEAVADCI